MSEEPIESGKANKCFCCGRQLLPSAAHDDHDADYPATVFVATGNWGSTILDGPEPNQWTIRICDACVVFRRHLVETVGVTPVPKSLRPDVVELLIGTPMASPWNC